MCGEKLFSVNKVGEIEMWNLKRFSKFFILLLKVSNIRAGCSWNENCSVKCESNKSFWQLKPESIVTTMKNLNDTWNEVRHFIPFSSVGVVTFTPFTCAMIKFFFIILSSQHPNCHEEGIVLVLDNLDYPDTLQNDFFTADIKVRELTIKLNFVISSGRGTSEKIEVDAFHVNGLKFLKKLSIINVAFSPIKNGIFNGLEQLETLYMEGRLLTVIEGGILDVMNGTLKEFTLKEFSVASVPESLTGLLQLNSKELWIDGLTGSIEMKELENVKFKYNLSTSIVRSTFVGLVNVKTLDLSDCQIETIASGSFDSMKTMEVLRLENNRLTTIPNGFFDNILIRNRTQIFLNGNQFICDCNLMPFKMSLIEHSNFVGEVNCHKPDKFVNQNIISINFVDDTCVIPTTPSPTPSPVKQCNTKDTHEQILLDAPARKIEIDETEHENVVTVRFDRMENAILIWFRSFDPKTNPTASEDINCRIGSGSTFRMENLMENSAYTICLMDRKDVTTSPLNCLPYVRKSYPSAVKTWLYNDARSSAIGIILVGCSLSFFIGLIIGSLSYKVYNDVMETKKQHDVRSYQSSRASSMR